MPQDRPLTLVSYRADQPLRAFVEPVAVHSKLATMPLFLDCDHYVNLPLEETYARSYAGIPRRWQSVIEATGE